MIQRIQSVFLLVAALVGGTGYAFADLWKNATEWVQAIDLVGVGAALLASVVLALLCLLVYKNRKLQMRLNWMNIVLNVLLIGLMVYRLFNLPGGLDSEKGIGLLIPFAMILLLFLANRAIKRDQELVKSIDRIR